MNQQHQQEQHLVHDGWNEKPPEEGNENNESTGTTTTTNSNGSINISLCASPSTSVSLLQYHHHQHHDEDQKQQQRELTKMINMTTQSVEQNQQQQLHQNGSKSTVGNGIMTPSVVTETTTSLSTLLYVEAQEIKPNIVQQNEKHPMEPLFSSVQKRKQDELETEAQAQAQQKCPLPRNQIQSRDIQLQHEQSQVEKQIQNEEQQENQNYHHHLQQSQEQSQEQSQSRLQEQEQPRPQQQQQPQQQPQQQQQQTHPHPQHKQQHDPVQKNAQVWQFQPLEQEIDQSRQQVHQHDSTLGETCTFRHQIPLPLPLNHHLHHQQQQIQHLQQSTSDLLSSQESPSGSVLLEELDSYSDSETGSGSGTGTAVVDDDPDIEDPSLEVWKNYLLGRQWEIFWKQNSSTAVTKKTTMDEKITSRNKKGKKNNNKSKSKNYGHDTDEDCTDTGMDDDDDTSSSSCSYKEDWYDATIIGYEKSTGLFDVQFLGDEEGIIHKMKLIPESVRPSARAWIKRTKAILFLFHQQEQLYKQYLPNLIKDGFYDEIITPAQAQAQAPEKASPPPTATDCCMLEWLDQNILPPDSSTVNDQTEILRLKQQTLHLPIHNKISDETDLPVIISASLSPWWCRDEHEQSIEVVKNTAVLIQQQLHEQEYVHHTLLAVQGLIQMQLYLRTKLAMIVNDDEDDVNDDNENEEEDDDTDSADSDDKDNNGHDDDGIEPTEEYVEFLMKCLQILDESCRWHCKCWDLFCSVFSRTRLKNSDESYNNNYNQQLEHHRQPNLIRMTLDDVNRTFVNGGLKALVELSISTLSDISPKVLRTPSVESDAAAASIIQRDEQTRKNKQNETRSSGKRSRPASDNGRRKKKHKLKASSTSRIRTKIDARRSGKRRKVTITTDKTPSDDEDDTPTADCKDDDDFKESLSSLALSSSVTAIDATTIHTILNRVKNRKYPSSWYAHSFVKMFHLVVKLLLEPLLQCESMAYFLLGDKCPNDKSVEQNGLKTRPANNDNLSSGDVIMTDMVQKRDDKKIRVESVDSLGTDEQIISSNQFVSYEDIETFLLEYTRLSQSERSERNVWRYLQINPKLVERLQKKLDLINAFESKAHGCIAAVFDDNQVDKVLLARSTSCQGRQLSLEWMKESDPVLTSIRDLLEYSTRPNSANIHCTGITSSVCDGFIEYVKVCAGLHNVHPLGRLRRITRKLLKDSIAYRSWFLDLKYCELVRERTAFAVQVIGNYITSIQPSVAVATTISGGNFDEKSYTWRGADALSTRVDLVSSKLLEHTVLLNQYADMLKERNMNLNGRDSSDADTASDQGKNLLSFNGASSSLHKLQTVTKFISIEEEMIAVRLDVLLWREKAATLFQQEERSNVNTFNGPSLTDLLDLKNSMDLLLEGVSKSRMGLVSTLLPNVTIDTQIKDFARTDLETIGSSLYFQTKSLCMASLTWKDRADTVLTNLEGFGHPCAGSNNRILENVAFMKQSPQLVNMNRIDDLLQEYEILKVISKDEHTRLKAVKKESYDWSSLLTRSLSNNDPNNSFSDKLELIKTVGRNRPRGVIIHPLPEEIELLHELLQWYVSLKDCLRSRDKYEHITEFNETLDSSLLSGLCVLERYSQERCKLFPKQFLLPGTTKDILSLRFSSLFPQKTRSKDVLTFSKLESSSLCITILEQMTNVGRDAAEGYPLASCLYAIWTYFVNDFVQRSQQISINDSSVVTLSRARYLREFCPTLPFNNSLVQGNIPEIASLPPYCNYVVDLESRITNSERVEHQIVEALKTSKELRKISSSLKIDKIMEHQEELRRQLEHVIRTRDSSTEAMVPVDASYEKLIEDERKVFEWLKVAVPYFSLLCNQNDFALPNCVRDVCHEILRIPWDTLVSLQAFKTHPVLSTASSDADFDRMVQYAKYLFRSARKWQDDASNLNKLTIRGKSRRENKPSGGLEDCILSLFQVVDVEMGDALIKDPILSKVIMPQEEVTLSLLQASVRFEQEINVFFGKEYDGACPDRVAIPDSDSLVSDDGTILLFRLTDGPIFQATRRSLAILVEIGNNLAVDDPRRVALEWIQRAIGWIESLRLSVITSSLPGGPSCLMIPGKEATNLLHEGEATFFNIPNAARWVLARFKISIEVDDERMCTIECSKGGISSSVGTTTILWCQFLLNALRFDILQLTEWESSIMKMSKDCLALRKKLEGKASNDTSTLLSYYRFREELSQLLEEVNELFATPEITLVESSQSLLMSIILHLQSHTSCDVAKMYAESRYCDAETVTQDRFSLLDALVRRKAVAPLTDDFPYDQDLGQGPFRSAARVLFYKAFIKGLFTMELANDDLSSDLCAFRAWEVERALFDAFQLEHGEIQISTDYREKARTLRRSLEDIENVGLCAQAIVGDITPEFLVRMSTDQLANAKTKKDREEAALVARKGIVLTTSIVSSPPSPSFENNKSAAINEKSSTPTTSQENCIVMTAIPQVTDVARPLQISMSDAIAKNECAVEVPLEAVKLQDKGTSHSTESDSALPVSAGRSILNFATRPKSTPPPPPPSLAASIAFATKSNSTRLSSKKVALDRIVTSKAGGVEFYFSVADGSRKFFAHLNCEIDPDSQADRFLPEKLTEKGRLQLPEFRKFLKAKLESGRWHAVTMVVCPISDRDTKEYKKYYRDYEVKERIAMFGLDEGSKIFLVTPKFHKHAPGITFGKQSSTYVIALTRKLSSL